MSARPSCWLVSLSHCVAAVSFAAIGTVQCRLRPLALQESHYEEQFFFLNSLFSQLFVSPNLQASSDSKIPLRFTHVIVGFIAQTFPLSSSNPLFRLSASPPNGNLNCFCFLPNTDGAVVGIPCIDTIFTFLAWVNYHPRLERLDCG